MDVSLLLNGCGERRDSARLRRQLQEGRGGARRTMAYRRRTSEEGGRWLARLRAHGGVRTRARRATKARAARAGRWSGRAPLTPRAPPAWRRMVAAGAAASGALSGSAFAARTRTDVAALRLPVAGPGRPQAGTSRTSTATRAKRRRVADLTDQA